jgi:hypothetical protein
VRYLLLVSVLLFACNPLPEPPPDVVVIVPPEPIPEPQALPPIETAPPKIIGHFHGVPIPEQGPWTRTLPRPTGTFSAKNVSHGSTALPPGHRPVTYEAGAGTLHGTYALTVCDHPTSSPRLRVELQVKSGRVRVFLKYVGDIYFTLDAEPGALEVLEGAGIPGSGMSLTVWFEALDGTAQLESLKVTTAL